VNLELLTSTSNEMDIQTIETSGFAGGTTYQLSIWVIMTFILQ
jgi:hypothetical protein